MADDKQAVRELLQAIADRDHETLDRLVAADATWWAPASAALDRPLRGKEAVVTLLSGTYGFFQAGTTKWSVIALVQEGPTVVAHVRRECLATNGRPYDNEYLLRFDFTNGQIVEAWEHTDTAYANAIFQDNPA
jgi:ketosteroid isomerase-like protein